MARYGQAFKDRLVARLLPPESAAVEAVAREAGISAETSRSIWDTHTPEFSDGFPADFLSLPACKSAMLAPWLTHALKSSRRKVLKDAITASSGVSAAHFYAETTS